MSDKLLPCPFCNGYPKIMQAKIQYCSLHGEPYQDYIAKCCFVEIKKSTKIEVIQTWNTRASKQEFLKLNTENK